MEETAPGGELRRRKRRVPDEDRKRASKACDRCKKRKNRCSPSPTGACRRCQIAGYNCSFTEVPDMRAVNTQSPQAHLSASAPLRSEVQNRHSPSSSSPVRPQIENMANDIALTPSEYPGWASFFAKLHDTFCVELPKASSHLVQNNSQCESSSTSSEAQRGRLKAALSRFPPWKVAQFLVSVQIEHGTDCFFYFDQPRFMADLFELYHQGHSHHNENASFVCLALAVFALGSQWTALSKPTNCASVPVPEDQDPGRIFYDTAQTLIGDVVQSSSLTSVQAVFVLSVYLLPASAFGAAFVYMGLALRKAMTIELHRESSDAATLEVDRESRRRLWWAIDSLERTLTIKLNKPPSVDAMHISARLPDQCSGLDDNQKFDNLPLQRANAQLIAILDKISSPYPSTSSQMLPLENKLKQWKASIPRELRREVTPSDSSNYRAVMHLHLNYYFAWIAMGRVAVVTVARAHVASSLHRDQTPTPLDPAVLTVAHSCIKSARKMLGLFEDLHKTGNITRFSFTDFQGCSIATIVLLVGSLISGEQECRTIASAGLDYLRLMAGKQVTPLKGVRFVEAVQTIVVEASLKARANKEHRAPFAPVTSDPAASDYNQWAEWLQTVQNTEASRASQGSLAEYPTSRPLSVTQDRPIRQQDLPASLANDLNDATFPVTASQSLRPHAQQTTAFHTSFGYDRGSNTGDQVFASTAVPTWEGSNGTDHDFMMGLTGLSVLDFPDEIDMDLTFGSPVW
ncbi:hypothetical protein D0867_02416 [Hortaea werneckii]|uniref:Zn(2)-C6 fungal-type domain-containing protein n=1 Tax=Hortaea werneckii TaxID=91943 RepID=A0A3M7A5M3_HORWE|nr:hypothetical protein D0867_02416 [Hortaea werneckii]RMY38719.1 hypothetical protein D0866_02407 [Hortaea werneckii]